MRKHRPLTAASGPREVLDYFGKCPECGYPATASATLRENHTVFASCDRPCGWSGVVPLTTMTQHRMRAEAHD
ncbi:hypothetical protein [Nocardia blacklockiae]|uniref:hypothetical protein n=1 Tax=Nocardia blacklockiae TaxID=480036 RepID=UPI0018944E83|nr:hypothetical protein [Nocardia blacklockiae]MBF6171427.1 hypothetical protein [Nocardia blacklockiae]